MQHTAIPGCLTTESGGICSDIADCCVIKKVDYTVWLISTNYPVGFMGFPQIHLVL